ncbi:MAG: aspartyl/glutamyl-tRNA amidotransferase subunit A [Nanoarchaeota archaeon]|nr:aspartyl/glutamyl-tRNA amidotransferase subunit A [Nanoarchaeota archaeon]
MSSSFDIKKKLEDLKSGKLSCLSNLNHFLDNIKKKNKEFNIFLELNPNAKARAKELDEKVKNSGKLGSLFGLVFATKSNISVKDMYISCASKTLKNYKGTFNADVIEMLEAQDAIHIGIVNNDEFASGSSGENSAFGNTINPFSTKRIPGGSSSGSAASVAADMCDFSLGSDTGGSIRNPASHCGIIGVKPSYGRVSRYGLVDLSMSLDQIGPLSKDIYTSALVMSTISGLSENDSTTVNEKVHEYENQILKKKYKIAWIKTFKDLIVDKRIQDILDKRLNQLKELGHEIIEIDIKNIDLAIQAYYPIVYTEFFSGTRKFDSVKYGHKIEETCGEEALRRILGGKEISRSEFDGAYYKKALKVKEIIANEFERVFKDIDFILMPTTPMIPHKFGTKLTTEEMYAYDAYTIPANLAGICAAVISKDTVEEEDGKVSVGLQIYADKFKEDILFQALNLLDSLK